MTRAPSVLIIGAGVAGLGTAIRLLQSGIDDIVILERGESAGGLTEFIRFGVTVTGLNFDEHTGTWSADTAGGETFTGRTVVMATGPLADASWPDIRGLNSYTGHKIHSARWDRDYDLSGKRVAVIGTGASAVRIIPELVETAAKVKVFQRTPRWVLPRHEFVRLIPAAVGMVWDTPATTAIQLIAKANLRRQIRDPWKRRQLTPDFRAGSTRTLMSSDYYPALEKPNCKLITWPIATISPRGIRTADGIEHEVDCIVFATGSNVTKAGTPFPITGLDGRKLADDWASGAYAYKCVSVSGYPNLFLTFGPNSGPGHNSAQLYRKRRSTTS